MVEWIEALGWLELGLVVLGGTIAFTLLGLAMGYASEAYWQPRHRKVFELPLKKGQLRTELLGTIGFHLLFVPTLTLAIASGAIRFVPFSEGGWLAEILGFWVPWYGFMVFYYFLHRAMHHPRLFWMHRWHHVSMVTTPMTGFSMHPAEGVGWIVGMLGPCILLLQLDLLGFWGFVTWLSITWSGNIAGHANAEFFPVRSSRLSSIWSNPISYHSLHHARFTGHYGFVAAFMDRLFGTEFADWKELHDRVYDGHPLTSLREKGPSYQPHTHASQAPADE
jgi:sterol desaturase/sphingolipid hydroxylase (fatty acid hydroxylase superfamily)